MITSDSPNRIVEHFRAAAVGLATWSEALGSLGDVIATPITQLAGMSGTGGLAINHVDGVSDDMMAGYYAERGYDPAVNPRTRGLIEAAPYQCVTDADLVGDRRDEWPIYDFFKQSHASHAALVRLGDRDRLMSGLAVMRSAAAGPIDREQLRLLRAVAPGIEGAVHAAIALGSVQDRVVVDTAETLDGAVILLGGDGELVSLSPAAEAILNSRAELLVRSGCLCLQGPPGDHIMGQAIRRAALSAGDGRAESRVIVPGQRPGAPLQLHFFPLPLRRGGPLSAAQVLLTIRATPTAGAIPDAAMLRRTYGLTAAEAEIAALVAAGRDPQAIAAARGSSVRTVRSQLKTIFGKTGTHRQAELAVLLRDHAA